MNRRLFGIDFSALGATEIADLVTGPERPTDFRMLVTANLDHVAQLSTNTEFRKAYEGAWLATMDGTPVHLYARLRGSPTKSRVPGADLLPMILERLVPGLHRPFFTAASTATLDALVAQLIMRGFDREAIGGDVPVPGFEGDPQRSADLANRMLAHRATHVFMGVGAPKSEIWMHGHRRVLGGCYGFGFGAGLDYAAGTKMRAPVALRMIGMEWAWRVASEPRRLIGRYFVRSWGFLRAIALDLQQSRLE